MRWQSITNAPLDGTTVLARCGDWPGATHLVAYVSGAWMDIHGGYVLTEEETGLPTHFASLSSRPEHPPGRMWTFLSERPICAAVFLVALLGLSMLLGAAIENRFDLLSN